MKLALLSGDDWDEIYPVAAFTSDEKLRDWLSKTETCDGGLSLRVFDVVVDPEDDEKLTFERPGFISKTDY